jgi:hypothetical protein
MKTKSFLALLGLTTAALFAAPSAAQAGGGPTVVVAPRPVCYRPVTVVRPVRVVQPVRVVRPVVIAPRVVCAPAPVVRVGFGVCR